METGIHKSSSRGRENMPPMGLDRACLSLLALQKEQEVKKYTELGKQMGEEWWKAETRWLQGTSCTGMKEYAVNRLLPKEM